MKRSEENVLLKDLLLERSQVKQLILDEEISLHFGKKFIGLEFSGT